MEPKEEMTTWRIKAIGSTLTTLPADINPWDSDLAYWQSTARDLHEALVAAQAATASDEDLSYLSFCERGATSGPWRIEFDIEDGRVTDKHTGVENEGGTLVIRDDWGFATQEDFEFICAARNIVPGLLGRLNTAESNLAAALNTLNYHNSAASPFLGEGAAPQMVLLTSFSQLSNGDSLLIVGNIDGVEQHLFHKIVLKETAHDGQEVILQKKGNIYFNFGMYLQKTSWVKQCFKLLAAPTHD